MTESEARTRLFPMLLPIVLGYGAAAIAFGALATALHFGPAIILGFSLLLYSGALQSTVLGLAVLNPSFILVLAITVAVNLRHMLYGPHLQSQQKSWRHFDRWVMAGMLTDELYALGLDPTINRAQWRISGIILYTSWAAATALGVAGAHLVPHRWLLAFGLALPSLFVGLLIPRLSARADWVAAIVAALLAIVGRLLHLPDVYNLVPIMIGTSAAYWAHSRMKGESS